MSVQTNVSISISPELHAAAGRMLACERDGTFGEVVRAGLRLLGERERSFRDYAALPASATRVPQQPLSA